MRPVLAFLAVLAAACGGPARGPEAPKPPPGVESAALPFHILEAEGGREIEPRRFYAELARADAVCIGESHRNPHHHWAQLELVGALVSAAPERAIGLGMEMFQRPFQQILDDYAAGRIDDDALLSRSGWSERWGYDWALYRPIVRRALDGGAELVALSVATELRREVSEHGISGVSEAHRARLPEMDLEDAAHRAWFEGVMGAMGGAAAHTTRSEDEPAAESGERDERGDEDEHGDEREREPEHEDEHGGGAAAAESKADRIYSVQVLWDETMAETAADWLARGPGRQIVILAGNGHCHDSAIVQRMKRRGVANVVSVRPVIDREGGELSGLIAEPENDYLFVMRMPER